MLAPFVFAPLMLAPRPFAGLGFPVGAFAHLVLPMTVAPIIIGVVLGLRRGRCGGQQRQSGTGGQNQ